MDKDDITGKCDLFQTKFEFVLKSNLNTAYIHDIFKTRSDMALMQRKRLKTLTMSRERVQPTKALCYERTEMKNKNEL